MRSNSPRESFAGSQMTPPFAPPNGIFTTAHFQVISLASARISSSVTLGAKRTPPLARPAHQRMMHAIADEYLESSVIQRHGYVDGDLLVRITHEPVDAVFQAQLPGGNLEARLRRSVNIHFIVR